MTIPSNGYPTSRKLQVILTRASGQTKYANIQKLITRKFGEGFLVKSVRRKPARSKEGVAQPCCNMMSRAVLQVCPEHPNRYDCPDCLIDYEPASKDYGIIIHDGGTSAVKIRYCPWCGRKL
jgi:hypothetical protein